MDDLADRIHRTWIDFLLAANMREIAALVADAELHVLHNCNYTPNSASSEDDCMAHVQILSALLTPLIAIITTYIAFQQYQTSRSRFRYELYDRRLVIYDAVIRFIYDNIGGTEPLSVQRLYQFKAETAQCFFLLGGDVYKLADEVYRKAVDLRRRRLNSEDPTELFNWFADQLDSVPKDFARHLSLSALR